MFFILKTSISFIVFYIFLSFPLKNKPIFLYMYEYTSAATSIIYKNLTHLKMELNKEIIQPSVNKIETTIYKKVDTVSTKLSGIKKQKRIINQIKERAESVNHHFKEDSHDHHHHNEDKEKLLNLLR
jgi:hypothetical protein